MGDIVLDQSQLKSISSDVAWHYRVLPAGVGKDDITLYVEEESDTDSLLAELELVLDKRVKFVFCSRAVLEKALSSYYIKNRPQDETAGKAVANFDAGQKDFVSMLIQEAKLLKSSDIHIETYEQKCRIRLRIDGKLVERIRLNKTEYPSLINKVKIMAGMDISEKRLPQDGRIFFTRDDSKFDIRVSVLPTLYGEKIVLRLLGSDAAQVDLDDLGFSAPDLLRYRESIRKPNGIVLISGPTGSGKTTTLYATLKLLNNESVNILTVEDPIEYTLEGVNQVQVKDDIGLTFARSLRTFLRQDPNVIMLGEIRDTETANLAIRAALTGHLVLSTIHTNSAWGTVSRLIDMGIPPFLIASYLNASLAQRLVRVLCPHCKQKSDLKDGVLPHSFRNKHLIREHYVAKGCPECFFTGYKGRKAIYEVIPVDSQVSDFISANEKDVAVYFKSLGIKTLQESALDVLQQGETSIEEIYSLLLDDRY